MKLSHQQKRSDELTVNEVRAAFAETAPQTVPAEETARRTVAQRTAGRSPFLVVEEVAARYRTSEWGIRDLARRRSLPHFRRSGSRRLLFRADWLDAWDAGAPLEVLELDGGGRIVRPQK
jgi:hypothetical protein